MGLKACFSPDVDSYTVKVLKSKSVVQVGFEPTPPKRLELESSALDRSATEPVSVLYNLRNSAFVAQLAARGSHNPKVAGSIPVESIYPR